MELIAKKNIPNYITVLRIVGTVCLLFLEPLSLEFYIIYTLSGFSDVVDGYIARKWKLTSEFGAKLDSIADLLFYAVMVLKILPLLIKKLPLGVWIAVGVVLLIRAAAYIVAAFKYKSFASLHTYMNKMTGAGVFLLPYMIQTVVFVPFCMVLSVVAASAAGQELFIHIRGNAT
ncbi:MAG: CDP-alcohol phosphatidyltransferase family protein [Lachnospiraceae bacterium]|nr:CDP-alcohol phosphatidyltransferase family protein [Lachnospiraceae bacterium]MBQ7781583.1 CDP-alcohol phosphatidyltransferase family protein [Lachnospiraceae bacterium]